MKGVYTSRYLEQPVSGEDGRGRARSPRIWEVRPEAVTAPRVSASVMLYSYIRVIRLDQSSVRRQSSVGAPSSSAITLHGQGRRVVVDQIEAASLNDSRRGTRTARRRYRAVATVRV